jgi:glutamate-5-semialdehyde dehydrogenase
LPWRDWLLLNDARIDEMLEGIDTVARQEDPIGKVSGWLLPKGLRVERTTVPLGVAAIIYESRVDEIYK